MKIINGDENKMRVPDALKGLPGLNEVVGFEVDFSAENQSNYFQPEIKFLSLILNKF